MSLGVLIAVPDEAKSILDDSFWKWNKLENGTYQSEKYDVYLGVSGVGKAFAVYTFCELASYCDTFLNLGTSGGLSTQRPGDVYICSSFVEHDMDVSGIGIPKGVTPFSGMKDARIETEVDAKLKTDIESFFKKKDITLQDTISLSGDSFFTNAEEARQKKELFKGEIVDMESAPLAKICRYRLQAPFLSLRYVTDNANHEAAEDWQVHVKKSAELFDELLKALVT